MSVKDIRNNTSPLPQKNPFLKNKGKGQAQMLMLSRKPKSIETNNGLESDPELHTVHGVAPIIDYRVPFPINVSILIPPALRSDTETLCQFDGNAKTDHRWYRF